MDSLPSLASLTPLGALIAVLAAPYLALASGRLQPRKNVEDWRDAYFKSEAARSTERETTSRLLTYAEAADHLLRTALGPSAPAAPPTAPPAPPRGASDDVAS